MNFSRISTTLAAILLLISVNALGRDAGQNAGIHIGSLEWQKIDLETKLQERLHTSILKFIPDKYFTVSVGITLQKFDSKKVPTAAASPNPKSDRISLGKLDFDAPVLEEDDDGQYLDSFGDRKKARVLNLFDALEKVNVVILLDNTIPDAKKDIIQKLAKNVTSSLGQDVADILIDKVDLYTPKVFVDSWDSRRWFSEFKIPVTVVSSTLILAIFMGGALLFIFRGFISLEQRKTAVVEAKNAREEAAQQAVTTAAEEARQATESLSGSSKVDAASSSSATLEGSQKGFERFKLLLKDNPEKMSELVRQWIKAPSKGSTEALVMLPQVLSTSECLQLFKYLSQDDRKEWKKVLSTPVDEKGHKVAENFVSFQIVDSLLVPPSSVDAELQTLLAGASLADCVEIATQDVLLGALLLDLLPTGQAGRLYSLMSRDLADSIATACMKVSDEEITAQSGSLKYAIKNAANKKKAVPFLDRASELVSVVGPEKEDTILKALADAGEFQLLEATAKQYFPSELILKLPKAVIKACLERYPSSRRAEIIVSRAEDQRTIFLESIGKAGSKVRDLIEVDIQQINADEVRKKRIEKSRNLIWRDFIDNMRTLIKTNETISELSKEVMADWLSEKTGGQYRGSDAENVG